MIVPPASPTRAGKVRVVAGTPVDADGVPIVGGSGGGGGGGSTALPVDTTLTASGAIPVTARVVTLEGAANTTHTLAAGTTDGQPMGIKRLGAGTRAITASFDGVSQTLTMDSTVISESLNIVWSASPRNTWLVGVR